MSDYYIFLRLMIYHLFCCCIPQQQSKVFPIRQSKNPRNY